MSAAAVPIYKMLIAKGVSEEEARQVAEDAVTQAVDVRLSECRWTKNIATREDIAELRNELRREIKFTNRIGIGLLAAMFMLVAQLVIGA